MASIGQRKLIIKEMAFHFAELGYIPTAKEYKKNKKIEGPHSWKDIIKHCYAYSKLITYIKKYYPDLVDFTKPSAVDDAAEVMSTPDPLARLRASNTEK